MWWSILIMALALALVVGPVMWLSPSPQDVHLTKLRNRAAALGIQINLVPRDKLAGRPALSASRSELAFYCLPWESYQRARHTLDPQGYWSVVKQDYQHDRFINGRWYWQAGAGAAPEWSALASFLQALPETILACEVQPQGVSLGWLERGDVAEVEQLHERLQALRELSLQPPPTLSSQPLSGVE